MESKNFTHPILFVEDNPVDIDLTMRAFSKRNLANPLQIVRDGEEALGLLEKWEEGAPLPVVILLDLKLPRVHGLDVLQAIKSNSTFKKIPVVILTTSSDDDDIKTAYDLGANSYIIKPVDFDKFLDVAAQIELYWNVFNKPFLGSAIS
jgi:CheY-like chemotaxis protein